MPVGKLSRLLSTLRVLSLAGVTGLSGVAASPPAPHPAGCEADLSFHRIDFWVGSWRAYVNGTTLDGTDDVEKILDGCAIVENWHDANGSEGKSLFYYNVFTGRFRQIWVTGHATQRGGLKEKEMIAVLPGGGVRFQGVLPGAAGTKLVLDRTTLTPLSRNRVHQLIEYSLDGGSTWKASYDAIYVRSAIRKARANAGRRAPARFA